MADPRATAAHQAASNGGRRAATSYRQLWGVAHTGRYTPAM